jgi:hypothetical protein
MADMLIDHKTRNLVIDEFFRTTKSSNLIPGAGLAHLLYESTVVGDSMRAIVRDCFVHTMGDVKDFNSGNYPYEFLKDVTAEFLRLGVAGHLRIERDYDVAGYFRVWNPTFGQHRYYSGPESEGVKHGKEPTYIMSV